MYLSDIIELEMYSGKWKLLTATPYKKC